MSQPMTTSYRPFTSKLGLYPYSSVQINVPAIIAEHIIQWGDDMIHDTHVYNPFDATRGREEEIHITALYGIHAHTPDEIHTLLYKQQSFEVKLDKVSTFKTNQEFDVVKIEATSPGLHHLNLILKNNITNTTCYSNYSPHVTIAYVKKDSCDHLVGVDKFKGWKWTNNSVIFSSKNGEKTPIRLNTLKVVECY